MTLSAADILKKRWPPIPCIRIWRTPLFWGRNIYTVAHYDGKGGKKPLATTESRQRAIAYAARVAFAHGIAVRGLGWKEFLYLKRAAAAKRAKRVAARARRAHAMK
jgi:hypothetical protein